MNCALAGLCQIRFSTIDGILKGGFNDAIKTFETFVFLPAKFKSIHALFSWKNRQHYNLNRQSQNL